MKNGSKHTEKTNFENGKIYVIYDEIYDTHRKEKRRRNYYCKIVRFPNPQVLIIRALSEVYNLKDRVEYLPRSYHFGVLNTHSYFNGEKRSVYETLLLMHALSGKGELAKNASAEAGVNPTSEGTNEKGKNDATALTKVGSTRKPEDLYLFHILSELQQVYEYLFYLYGKCYQKYTRLFFINLNYNLVGGFIKLQYVNSRMSSKYKNVSLDNMLNRLIKLLHFFSYLGKNYDRIECIVLYVYFYTFLCVPICFYPWGWPNFDLLSRKILKDGNVNMIINHVYANRRSLFSMLLNITEESTGYFETYDFNLAILMNEVAGVSDNLNLRNDDRHGPYYIDNNSALFEKKEDYINLSEYRLLKDIGYNSLMQLYKPHFYHLTVLRRTFLFHSKMKVILFFLRLLAERLVEMDRHYGKCVRGEQ
ncbi:conserved Plasmodium protein, unknown function [Plasmodium knowlesi strain H]|uniref:Uncharacterized protein n=3 Tax=Plasmodium knowlesi TaxID=5850 RepID=A0A5K1V4Z5_PLAKH|nr:conserved Plasmodium protein, unknown function [Plasmodium knowlesi strain H]OTN65426.1 Uncharacterized protein PKNOH_S110096400 [Plasmodium knowlesi]CAA9989583.1 conserved Plasmodium protein, unknown function [Plasmodium knowlesi strain H]SBO22636.1 conserved Plasmodium protein, unknown function [Plasmodium knowlesi strain H]SBO23417.1 conserved Plasmodium protein, unknown function [Plasmodium knowlesi strain H]VVS79057.1 conserved Plasmodium protein, unknown function [Plasmodium knowlesi |eukprot:XP_002260308.1 hypothetical protein, conserved in Plasmodium species [Plasmodium knowlesi strain H]